MKALLTKSLFFGSFLVLTFTFSNAQTSEWVARYNGTANQPDVASVLFVDPSGNSYAAGYVYDTVGGMGQHFGVVKYNPDGTRLWFAIHRDGGFSYVEALTVDPAGNVYITGYSTNISNGSFLLIKYDANGVLQWTKYLGVPGSLQDEGSALAADANYVYVAGKVMGNAFPYYHDIQTFKLNSSTGDIESGWPAIYNGTGNNEDVPTSLTLDPSGNIFVAGSSLNSSGDKDYVVNAYDQSGTSLTGWPQIFDGTVNLDDIPVQVVANGTYIAVTGNCNVVRNTGVGDIGTVLYDYNGNIVNGWPQVFNGVANDWDGVGNTGSSATYKPLALDDSGNVFVGGWTKNSSGNFDLITFKYNVSGTNAAGWPVIFDNGGKEDITRGLSLDASGDIIISGFTSPAGTFNHGNFITFEYDPAGNVMAGWPVYYDGPSGGDDQVNAVVAEGPYIWVAGYSEGNGTFSDFTIIKYSNSNATVAVHEKASISAFTCYPNPGDGKFIFSKAGGDAELIITNTLGEVVFKARSSSALLTADLSQQPSGLYFYRIIDENLSETTGKVIIQ